MIEVTDKGQAKYANKVVLMMAGGTGGHVYPALAVANFLHKRGAIIHWLGNKDGFEGTKVIASGFQFHDISVRGLRGNGWQGWLKAPFMVSKAIWRASKVIRTIKPDVVIGMGGFASGPGGVAAKISRVPLVIHEQNAVMGMTNKLLSRFASKVLLADDRAAQAVKQVAKVCVVGNPVREDISQLPPPEQRLTKHHSPVKLLVIGGSQGAKAINDCLPKALALLTNEERPQVLHQTGQKTLRETIKRYQDCNVNAEVVDFIEDMAKAYAQCDWVIARSGALSVAEIATIGVSAVFVPFPHAVDDHQTANAQGLVNAGAATLIAQSDLTPQVLAQAIKANNNHEYLMQRAMKARELSHANALIKIIQEIETYL